MSKTASGLIEYCKYHLGNPYWMGTYGQIATRALYEANKKRLPQYYTADDFLQQLGKPVFDCVGLIKGFRWSATPSSAPVYNAAQDVAVSGLYAQCSRRGDLRNMPNIPGVCVFIPRTHVGVYIGGGWVIEARGHAYGVVKTRLADRPWTQWGMPDWITYDTKTEDKTVMVNAKEIERGSTGGAVRTLQAALNVRGYDCGTADGIFGTRTENACKAFQKDNSLDVDGICGARTWAKLLN